MGWNYCAGCGRLYNTEKGCRTIGCPFGPKTKGLTASVVQAPPTAKKLEDSAAMKQKVLFHTSTQEKLSGSPTLTTLAGFGSPPPVASPFGQNMLKSAPKKISKEEYARLSSEAYFGSEDESDAAASGLLLYRGDDRPPNVMKGDGGFKAWVPISVDTARNMVKRGLGTNCSVDLPTMGKVKIVEHRLQPAFREKYNIRTLGAQIKLERTHDTFHISTDPTESAGGMGGSNIYRMKFPTVYLFDQNMKVLDISQISSIPDGETYLLLDKDSIDAATLIALVIGGSAGAEVSFLTSIPMEYIVSFKISGQTNYHKITI